MARLSQTLIHMSQGIVQLGVLKVLLLLLCQVFRSAFVPAPEPPAPGFQPCCKALGALLGVRTMRLDVRVQVLFITPCGSDEGPQVFVRGRCLLLVLVPPAEATCRSRLLHGEV